MHRADADALAALFQGHLDRIEGALLARLVSRINAGEDMRTVVREEILRAIGEVANLLFALASCSEIPS
jgi:hypothetical protein